MFGRHGGQGLKITRKVEGTDRWRKLRYQIPESLSEVIGLADVGRVGE